MFDETRVFEMKYLRSKSGLLLYARQIRQFFEEASKVWAQRSTAADGMMDALRLYRIRDADKKQIVMHAALKDPTKKGCLMDYYYLSKAIDIQSGCASFLSIVTSHTSLARHEHEHFTRSSQHY